MRQRYAWATLDLLASQPALPQLCESRISKAPFLNVIQSFKNAEMYCKAVGISYQNSLKRSKEGLDSKVLAIICFYNLMVCRRWIQSRPLNSS